MASYRQFYTDVLKGLGMPVTESNLRALATVAVIEGPNSRYNPLNSVVPFGNSTAFNSVGVQDYKSYNNGVRGTILLLQGSPWSGVRRALSTGSFSDVLNAFATEYATWGSHPDFGAITQSQADVQLGSDIGSGKLAGTTSTTAGGHPVAGASLTHPDPNAALYPATDLVLPLTADQKNHMGQYIKTAGGYTDADIAKYEKDNGNPDKGLVAFYDLVATGGIYNDAPSGISKHFSLSGVIPWADGLAKALSWITTLKNWERIGLFVLGASILVFAVIEMAHPPSVPTI